MGRVVTIKISGRGADTDAPTAEDLLDQVRDYLEILRGVEGAVAGDGRHAIEWRVVNAIKSSPLAIMLEAFPREYGTDVTRRALAVAQHTSDGLAALQRSPERPPYFPTEVLKRVEKTFERVTNGLDRAEVDFGPGVAPLVVTPAGARSATTNTQLALKPAERPYRELGSIEGVAHGSDVDGHGRHILFVRHRLTGDSVKCILSDSALANIGDSKLLDVYRGLRVTVRGVIYYKSLGQIARVKASEISIARSRSDLPAIDDILDENFTGGLRTEEYLERLRDGRLS